MSKARTAAYRIAGRDELLSGALADCRARRLCRQLRVLGRALAQKQSSHADHEGQTQERARLEQQRPGASPLLTL